MPVPYVGKFIAGKSYLRPSTVYLVLGWVNSRPIHIVAADNIEQRETIIITVYEPDLLLWELGFERKK